MRVIKEKLTVVSIIFLILTIKATLVAAENKMAHTDRHPLIKEDFAKTKNQHITHINANKKPRDCDFFTGTIGIEIRVGAKYAKNGLTYGYDNHLWYAPPCSIIEVTLINEDDVRHQWMVHDLPRYLYHHGMFTIEANGGNKVSAILTVPSDEVAYFVHCDMSHHMEKGLKGQLVIGEAKKFLPSIPGISAHRFPDRY